MNPATPSRTRAPAVGPGAAEHPDGVPAVGPDEPEEHPQQRGLAGAVGAEDAVDLALGDLQADRSTATRSPNLLVTLDGVDGKDVSHERDGRNGP